MISDIFTSQSAILIAKHGDMTFPFRWMGQEMRVGGMLGICRRRWDGYQKCSGGSKGENGVPWGRKRDNSGWIVSGEWCNNASFAEAPTINPPFSNCADHGATLDRFGTK